VKRQFFLQKFMKLMALLVLVGISIQNVAAEPIIVDTTAKAGDADSTTNVKNKTMPLKLVTKSPISTVAISALIPGGGQMYTGNYVKSGMFFAAEAIFGLITYYQYENGKYYHDNSQIWFDSLTRFGNGYIIKKDTVKNGSNTGDSAYVDTTFRSTNLRMHYNYSSFEEKENRNTFRQSALWMAGIYYWNILDALKNTRFFSNSDPKNPVTAGWLSAVPALGLGQFYNGELSKAGMIFTAQLSMAYMVYNYNDLMRICENNIRMLSAPGTRETKDPDAADLLSKWNSKHSEAFRNRNMWAWYSLVFYIYGVLDAVVDAHLHDAPTKMKLEPDLTPGQNKVGIRLKMNF